MSDLTKQNFTVPRLRAWLRAGGGEPKKPIIYRDPSCPGLIYLVRESGNGAFGFEAKLNRKTIRIVFDKTVHRNLGDAQGEAIRLKNLVNQGIDPRVAKAEIIEEQEAKLEAIRAKEQEKRREEKRQTALCQEPWEDYLLAHQSEWGTRHYRDHINLSHPGGKPRKRGRGVTVPGVLAPVLAYPIAKIDAEFLSDWLRTEAKTRANNARQGFEALRAFWNWVSKHKCYSDLIPDPRLFENAELLKAKPKRQAAGLRDVLERAHLADWFKAVQGIKAKEVSIYLQVLLLTGARRNELLGLRWDHIEAREPANIWIRDKVDGDIGRHVPLGPYALYLLNSLPKRKWVDDKGKEHQCPWVFANDELKPIHHDSPGNAHARVLSKAGLGHVSIHGLRRSYASLSEWLEIPSGVTAQVMGHKPSAIAERHYKRRPLELLAQHHCRLEGWILEQAGVGLLGSETGRLRAVK